MIPVTQMDTTEGKSTRLLQGRHQSQTTPLLSSEQSCPPYLKQRPPLDGCQSNVTSDHAGSTHTDVTDVLTTANVDKLDSDGVTKRLPRVLRFGIKIQSDSSESLSGSDTSDGSINSEEQKQTSGMPSVLRLARDSNTYISDKSSNVSVSGVLGGGISSPPEKKNKDRGSTEVSSLSTPSEVLPFQVFLSSTLSESESGEEIDEGDVLKDSRLLLRSLSPVDSLRQIFITIGVIAIVLLSPTHCPVQHRISSSPTGGAVVTETCG